MRRHPDTGKVVVLEARVVAGAGGGPDKTILNTPRFLADSPYHTICAYMHPPADPGIEQLREKAQRWNAPFYSIPDRGPWDLRVVQDMLALCRREHVALWHGHDYKSNALGLLLSRFWKMRLVTTVHGWVHHTARTPLYYWIDRFCLSRYERVLCVSEDLRQRCLECRVPPSRCLLLENGIDTAEFHRHRTVSEARHVLGLPQEAFVIGAVGRLSPEKGFDILIRALARLGSECRNVHLVIAGEGPEKSALQALIDRLELRGRVHLLGYQADPRPLYEALDLYVLSSLREGLPNVLLEAMAMEVPVLATRIAGIPQLIRDGENGLLISPGDEDGLAGAILTMRADAGQRQHFGTAGRATIENSYSFATRMDKIRTLYDELDNEDG